VSFVTIGSVVASKFYDPQTEKVSQSLVEKYVEMLKKAETFQKGSCRSFWHFFEGSQ